VIQIEETLGALNDGIRIEYIDVGNSAEIGVFVHPQSRYVAEVSGADIRYKPFRNSQYDLGFNPKIKANSYPTMPAGKR
jgi:hypothetical protein